MPFMFLLLPRLLCASQLLVLLLLLLLLLISLVQLTSMRVALLLFLSAVFTPNLLGYPCDGLLGLFYGPGYFGHQMFQIVLGGLKHRRRCVHFHLPIRRPSSGGKGSPAVRSLGASKGTQK
jgi:hypothetical protein